MRLTAVWTLLAFALTLALPALAQDIAPHRAQEHVQSGGAGIGLRVLSSRNDMVSGGDALVQVKLSDGIIGPVSLSLNGADITGALRPAQGARTYRALVTGLANGDNRLEARDLGRPAAAPARLTLTNAPGAGPIFAGPKETPFLCATQDFKLPVTGGVLGPPADADCSIETRVDYVYRSTDGAFKPLPDVHRRPADLATATTRDGVTAPYIVRVETGTVDRGIYQLAVLHDPAVEGDVAFFRRPRAWNGALVYQFGGGCTGGFNTQGDTTGGVLDDYLLSRGFAEASSSLNVYANNCDDLLASEVMMMTKERVIERLGPPTHTLGFGCSGGSYQAEQIADNYPGLLDGIVIGCSFPDVGHAAVSVHSFGARLIWNYFQHAAMPWTPEQQVAAAGLADAKAIESQATRPDRTDPSVCNDAMPAAMRWSRANPAGIRCTIYEHGATGFGRDPKTGLARRPLDNIGVQYGLNALNAGTITKDQFLDLNERIGGVDIDANFTPTRTAGDPIALRRGYETGRFLNGGGGLRTTPIIDYRAYVDFDNGDPHMRFHSFSLRERLLKANGNLDNLVMLAESDRYGLFSLKSPVVRGAVDAMDAWLSNLGKAGAGPPTAAQVAAAKPAGLTDACFTREGEKISETLVYGADTACNRLYPPHANPYIAAGEPVANDVVKCRLKAIDAHDYRPAFSASEIKRLRGLFPDGVCDWSRPGVEQRPPIGPWLTFSVGPSATRPAPKRGRT